jgi:peptide/nickel transport system ATP-binding protein/oligopeptide transport system ATP-binding protein
MTRSILEVNQLSLGLETTSRLQHVLRGVNFQIYSNEIVGLLGESGCGKSLTGLSLLNIFPTFSKILSGQIIFEGTDLLQCSEKQMEMIRGKKIGIIFQDPALALNPTKKIGDQLTEGLRWHNKLHRDEAFHQGIKWLNKVGISNAAHRMAQYPHEISGGMKQRIIIAMALACRPWLVIADEPTTALDTITQMQILTLLKELQQEQDLAILLITHDISVASQICDRLLIMYAGQIIESGQVQNVIQTPQHPYTQALLQAKRSLTESNHDPLFTLEGSPPTFFSKVSFCAFGPRCPHAMHICQQQEPLTHDRNHHQTACWLKIKEEGEYV